MIKMIETEINHRWKMLLPEHRANRPEWSSEDGWEGQRLSYLYDYIDAGDFVLYVGAEEGDMAALCQMWGAKLGLIEPNPLVWPNIKAIWEANKLERPMIMVPGFAGPTTDESALGAIFTDSWPPFADGPVIGDHGFKNLCEADGSIPRVRIDDLCKDVPPQLITIDVEGAEWEVLKGAEEILRKHHPRLVISVHPEFAYEIYKTYQADLRAWIKGLGYREMILDYQHELHLAYEHE